MKKKYYTIKISEDESRNRDIKEIFIKLIDIKIREQRREKYVKVSKGEFELIKKFLSRNLVPWYKYVKSEKDLKYKNEVGKYNGKRIVIK